MTQINYEQVFRNSAREQLDFDIIRYLLSNLPSRPDGIEKAERHMNLCDFYNKAFNTEHTNRIYARRFNDYFETLHSVTQQVLTDDLCESIGFPETKYGDYDIDELADKFFDIFHQVACQLARADLDYFKDTRSTLKLDRGQGSVWVVKEKIS